MPRRFPTPAQQRALWSAITGLALVTLGTIVVGLVWLGGKVLAYLQPVLVPLAMAAILAFLLQPVVDWLRSRGLTQMRAIAAVFTAFALVILLMAALIVPGLVHQINQLRHDFPSHVERAEANLRKLAEWPVVRPGLEILFSPAHPPPPAESAPPAPPDPENALQLTFRGSNLEAFLNKQDDVIRRWILDGLRIGGGKILGFIGYSIGFIMVPVYLFYFLKESAAIRSRWTDYVPLRRSRLKTEIVETLTEMNSYLVAFFRGQVLVSIIDGILTGLALQIMGLPYAIVIGLALAILGVMPFVGIILTFIPAVLIAAVHWGDWQHPLLVALIFLAIQQIDGLLIQPKIVGDSVGLHPMTIIFSILFWSLLLGGFIGALLAVPLTASVKVLFKRYLWERKISPPPRPSPAEPPPSTPDPHANTA